MTLLGRWDDDSLPVASPGNLNLKYSGCWGLTVNGREIAVLGGAEHVLFFDVTEATQPKLIGKFAGAQRTIWREFKSYKDRVYAVSDGTTEGLMIFDLSGAPDTIVRSYWSSEFFLRSHTITLDTTSRRIYLNGTNVASSGLLVLDISQDLDQPTLLANLSNLPGGYIHDSYVQNDTIYASSGFEGFFIFDCVDLNNVKLLAQIATSGYNHNSWSEPSGRYIYYTEEIPAGRPVQIVDLAKLHEGEIEIAGFVLDTLLGQGLGLPIPHNVYVRDTLMFNSQYEDGLLVYSVAKPEQPRLIAYYDTHSQNTVYNGYFGNWGNYPWLPSGNIIAGDMQNGLFILRLTPENTVHTHTPTPRPHAALYLTLGPNPAAHFAELRVSGCEGAWKYAALNAAGERMSAGQGRGSEMLRIELNDWPAGPYLILVETADGDKAVAKLMKL